MIDHAMIQRLATESGLEDLFDDGKFWRSEFCPSVKGEDLKKFAALIAEECAKLCDSRSEAIYARRDGGKADTAASVEAEFCAEAIRAAFNVGPAKEIA